MIELHSPQYRQVTFALAFGSFLVFCNLYLFQPMLPYLAQHFVVSETHINWLFAASTLALSVSLVPWAISSESIGRRQVMLLGLFAMPLIGLLMLISAHLWVLVLTRALMGIALAAFASVAVAYMVEELSPQAFNKAIGGYIAANSLGGISGRIAGGLLTDALGWQSAVIAMALFTLCGAVLVFILLPKQQHFTPQRGRFFHHNKAMIRHLTNRTLWLAMLIGATNFALFVNLYSVMGFRLVAKPYSLPIGLASFIFLCYLAGTLSSKLTSHWTQRFDPVLGMAVGGIFSMLGMWVANVESILFMLLGLSLISFGAFFTHTLAYAWVSQKATQAKATATALYLVHYYVGGSLGGFYLLYCWQHGGWKMVTLGGSIIYGILFSLCWTLSHRHTRSQETPSSSTYKSVH
ncbi:MFS transporter [Vibrio cincinnatiensis]|jgi:predicted MFS family arabinose efflux permease|uniref:MFS transporter n=1 Tax=Vibrio cincinnatiensis TaxID=675 RepID=UPI0013028E1E|nr:MFS transporter [Vibrio cincinnatiensis]MCG3737648.1 MFS transporter [Vibrio cincinnatiensis]